MRNSKPKPKRSKKGGKSKDDEEDEVMIVSESPPLPQRQLRSTAASKQQASKTSPSSSSLSINKPSKVSEKSTIISIDVNESETTKKLDHRKVETRSRQQQKNSTTDTDKNKTTSDFDLLKRGFDDNEDEEAGFEQQRTTTTTKQVAIIQEPISKSTSSSKPPSSKRNKLEKEDESKKIIVEQENTPSIAKDVIRVKNEPINVNDDLTLEPKKRSVGLTSRSNLNATTVVYSKNKPPPESLIKHETSMPLDESISEIKVKVKFEPMIKRSSIKRENTSTLGSSSSSGGENTQRNFKKFKKVPKASQKALGEKSIFKSVKQEKFDIDSQFNEFMNSMR